MKSSPASSHGVIRSIWSKMFIFVAIFSCRFTLLYFNTFSFLFAVSTCTYIARTLGLHSIKKSHKFFFGTICGEVKRSSCQTNSNFSVCFARRVRKKREKVCRKKIANNFWKTIFMLSSEEKANEKKNGIYSHQLNLC